MTCSIGAAEELLACATRLILCPFYAPTQARYMSGAVDDKQGLIEYLRQHATYELFRGREAERVSWSQALA